MKQDQDRQGAHEPFAPMAQNEPENRGGQVRPADQAENSPPFRMEPGPVFDMAKNHGVEIVIPPSDSQIQGRSFSIRDESGRLIEFEETIGA